MRRLLFILAAVVACMALAAPGASAKPPPFKDIDHFVVLYLENHSFDNLYGSFPGANGLSQADPAHTVQVDFAGQTLKCLEQNDPQLTSPPLPADVCSVANGDLINSHFANEPFGIDQYVPLNKTTRDLVHRYYQNQVQIDGGKNDKFVAGSDAKGLAMGYYDTSNLPLAQYAKRWTLADNFFQGAFGGSFLNHQWLIAARTPLFAGAAKDGGTCDIHSVLDANGMPVAGKDLPLTTLAHGDWAVNTIQPFNPPFAAGTADCRRLPPLNYATIGDRLSHAGRSWAWYAGGWDDANAGTPDPLFQYHHQPFAYFTNYGPAGVGREHLRDESEFIAAARAGDLPAVSFVKPIGEENEHPGYTDVATGEQHAVDLIEAVRRSSDWSRTAIIVTYDENGGFWDHVPPPVADRWGPGTRVPTLVISPYARRDFVDHESYDTMSILATIERRYGLAPLNTRDAAANDLRHAFRSSEAGG
jgi:acid phosphatase